MENARDGLGKGLMAVGKQYAGYIERSSLQEEAAKLQEARDMRLSELRKTELRFSEDVRREGRQADIDQDTNPENISKKSAAASGLILGTMDAEARKRTVIGQVDTQVELDRFRALAPAKRAEEIAAETEKLKALSSPEMLQATRRIAAAKHIVDPSYTQIKDEDGKTYLVNTRNPKDKQLLEIDGKPIIQANPEMRALANSALNKARDDMRAAGLEHKTALAAAMGDPAKEKIANDEYREARVRADAIAAPALALLMGKAGISPASAPERAPQPSASDIDGLKKRAKNPAAVAFFEGKYGKGSAAQYLETGNTEAAPAAATRPPVDERKPPRGGPLSTNEPAPASFGILDPAMRRWEEQSRPGNGRG